MDSLYLSFTGGREWIYVGYSLPTIIRGKDTARARVGDMALAGNGDILLGLRGLGHIDTTGELVDSVPGGLYRSRNDGNTWERYGTGLPNNAYITAIHRAASGTLVCVASEVYVDPRYVDNLQGLELRYDMDMYPENVVKCDRTAIYRSTDHGASWTFAFAFPARPALPTLDHRFTTMPDGRMIAVHPSAGVAISKNDGATWSLGDPLDIGNTDVNDVIFTEDGYAHLATDEGYVRIRTDNILSVTERPAAGGSLHVVVYPDGRLEVRGEQPWDRLDVYTIHGTRVRSVASGEQCTLDGMARGAYVVRTTAGNDVRSGLVMW